MAEKIFSAAADYLKFTFGAMLLAIAGFFLYAYILSPGADRREEFGAVWHSVEISLLAIFAVKLLTSAFSSEERIHDRLRGLGFESLGHIDRLILSVASVFLSINLLLNARGDVYRKPSGTHELQKPPLNGRCIRWLAWLLGRFHTHMAERESNPVSRSGNP